ncbi:MAG: hypothetical protein QMC38_13530 [Sinobacterium sp.]
MYGLGATAPGTNFLNIVSPPAVTGSLSLNAASIGLGDWVKLTHAALHLPAAGLSGVIGTSAGNCRAPSLYLSLG